jgi:hypothetical protein
MVNGVMVNEGGMEGDVAKGDNIEERLIVFAVRIMKVCDSLPKTPAGKHLSDQLLRSGTAPAPHYGEGRSAESKRDFIHKLRLALKELNWWLFENDSFGSLKTVVLKQN